MVSLESTANPLGLSCIYKHHYLWTLHASVHCCSKKTMKKCLQKGRKCWYVSALNLLNVVTVSGFSSPSVWWDMIYDLSVGMVTGEEWSDLWNQCECWTRWEITYSSSLFAHIKHSLCSTLRKTSMSNLQRGLFAGLSMNSKNGTSVRGNFKG